MLEHLHYQTEIKIESNQFKSQSSNKVMENIPLTQEKTALIKQNYNGHEIHEIISMINRRCKI